MIDWLIENVWVSFLYDFLKFCLAYGFSRWLYEGYYKSKKYGGWVLIMNDGEAEKGTRKVTPEWAEKIFKDEYDFSIYVKSFISNFFRLNNIDITSQKAKDIGLIKIDDENQKIIIDQSKNPPKLK